jgi:hypothetical protein
MFFRLKHINTTISGVFQEKENEVLYFLKSYYNKLVFLYYPNI